MIRLNGGEALCRALSRIEANSVFGVAGGKLGPFLKALAATPSIPYLGVRHEASGGFMAAAVYASTGRLAVALGEVGPGAVNLASGIAQAFNNNLALLAITSNNQHMASYPGRGMFMELDTQSLFRPITKWSVVVHDIRRIPELVSRAAQEAMRGRPGPVHLDIPQDIMQAVAEFDEAAFDAIGPAHDLPLSAADPAAIAVAAELLRGAARPLIIAGGGVVRSGASDMLRALAERLGAATVATQMGVGGVADDSPGFAGHGGVIGGDAVLEACRSADVVLAVGCRFSSWMSDENGPLVRSPQKLIQIDIDPSMLGRLRPLAAGLLGDARLVLTQLDAALGDGVPSRAALDWRDRIDAARRQWREKVSAAIGSPGDAPHPGAVAQAIGQALPETALAVYDGGHTSFWSNEFTPASQPTTRFHDPGICQLGFGLPFALALQSRFPDRPVFNITGDGAFGFTLQELDTARRYGLNVITIIHNNAAWGVIGMAQRRADFSLGTDLSGTDYAAIARGFGCYGETVTEVGDIGAAIGRALAAGKPAVLDCATRFEPHPAIGAFGNMGRYGL